MAARVSDQARPGALRARGRGLLLLIMSVPQAPALAAEGAAGIGVSAIVAPACRFSVRRSRPTCAAAILPDRIVSEAPLQRAPAPRERRSTPETRYVTYYL